MHPVREESPNAAQISKLIYKKPEIRTQHDSREGGGQWKFLSAIMEAREGYYKSPYPTDASRRGWGGGGS